MGRKKPTASCEHIAYRFYGMPSDHNTLYREIGAVPQKEDIGRRSVDAD